MGCIIFTLGRLPEGSDIQAVFPRNVEVLPFWLALKNSTSLQRTLATPRLVQDIPVWEVRYIARRWPTKFLVITVASGRHNNVTCLVAGYPPQRRSTRMLLILWPVYRDDVFGRHSLIRRSLRAGLCRRVYLPQQLHEIFSLIASQPDARIRDLDYLSVLP